MCLSVLSTSKGPSRVNATVFCHECCLKKSYRTIGCIPHGGKCCTNVRRAAILWLYSSCEHPFPCGIVSVSNPSAGLCQRVRHQAIRSTSRVVELTEFCRVRCRLLDALPGNNSQLRIREVKHLELHAHANHENSGALGLVVFEHRFSSLRLVRKAVK